MGDLRTEAIDALVSRKSIENQGLRIEYENSFGGFNYCTSCGDLLLGYFIGTADSAGSNLCFGCCGLVLGHTNDEN
tara:strand:+ start:1284 stop:1511 length:228 start_codon:yes stop_codon:yes gene_type:complete